MSDVRLGHRLRTRLGVAFLGAALTSQASWAASESVTLAPLGAVYELTLSAARSGTSVSSVAGRMVYDLSGSACEGYTQKMRFVTRMAQQSGGTSVSDLRSTTWEDGAGKSFRFDSTQVRDDNKT